MAPTPVPTQTGQDDQAGSPLEFQGGDWKAVLRRTAKEFKTDRGTLISAGMAYYWFLAIFPALLAAVGFLGLLKVSRGVGNNIIHAIRSALPGQAAGVLTDSVRNALDHPRGGSLIAVLIGLVLALWSASAGMVALQSGLDVAYDVDEERKFVAKRTTALLLIVAAAVLGGVASAAIVFGAPLGEALRGHLPFGGSVFTVLWTVARWLVGLLALTILFAVFYYLGPNRPTPRWTWVSPGGLVATLIWLVASLLFSFYVRSFSSYAKTYGSLTGVVVLILWMYLSALAVTFGGELNAELERQSAINAGETTEPPETRPQPEPHARQPSATPPPQATGDGAESAWRARMEELRRGR